MFLTIQCLSISRKLLIQLFFFIKGFLIIFFCIYKFYLFQIPLKLNSIFRYLKIFNLIFWLKKKTYVVNRSVHIFSKSKEHFLHLIFKAILNIDFFILKYRIRHFIKFYIIVLQYLSSNVSQYFFITTWNQKIIPLTY